MSLTKAEGSGPRTLLDAIDSLVEVTSTLMSILSIDVKPENPKEVSNWILGARDDIDNCNIKINDAVKRIDEIRGSIQENFGRDLLV